MQPADKSRYYLKAAAMAGAAGGVLSGVPFVNWANCLCCLWVLGAGFLAVYLVQKWSGQSVTPGEGATVGVLAGVITGLVASLIIVPLVLIGGGVSAPDFANMPQEMPPEMRQTIESLFTGGGLAAVMFLILLVSGAIFGTLGGLLGAAILGRREE